MTESNSPTLDPGLVEFIEKRKKIRAKIQTHAFTNGNATPNSEFSIGSSNSRIKKLAISYQLERRQESVVYDLGCYLKSNWSDHILAYPSIAVHLNILTVKEAVMDKDAPCLDDKVLADLVNSISDVSSKLRRLSVDFKPFMSTRGTIVAEVDCSARTYFENYQIIAEACKKVFQTDSVEDIIPKIPRSAGGVVAVAKYISNVPHYDLRSAAFFNVLRSIKLPSDNLSKIRVGEIIMSGVDGVKYENHGTIKIP